MKPELTEKQQALLSFLERHAERTGATPSLRRMAAHFGVKHAAIVSMLKLLEDKGYLRREGRYSRTIHLLNRAGKRGGAQRWQEVPIVGTIAAGVPLYAQQEWGGSVVVDTGVFRGRALFALRVKGDSMIEAGILDGDIAICEPRQTAENGDIVAALVGGEEATVKRFHLHKDKVELRPANRRFKPMFFRFDEVLIQGKVIGIQRGPDVLARL